MIERHTVAPRSPEWFALRGQDLTASEIGAVAGVGLYGSPYEVWAVKAGLAAPPEENSAMRQGRWLEPAVVAAHLETHPGFHIDYPLDLYVRDPDLRLGGTPDATGFDRDQPNQPIVFEFKVISRQSFERHWQAGPPMAYQLQTLGNTMLLDADYGILAALVLGFQDAELVVHRVERHAGAEAGIRDIARRFWEAFDEGHALTAPDYARDADILRQVFRPDRQKPTPIDLTSDNRLPARLARRARHKRFVKAAEADCKSIDAEIVHKLDGAEAALAGGWKISHTMAHRNAHMVQEADYPVLRITREKETP